MGNLAETAFIELPADVVMRMCKRCIKEIEEERRERDIAYLKKHQKPRFLNYLLYGRKSPTIEQLTADFKYPSEYAWGTLKLAKQIFLMASKAEAYGEKVTLSAEVMYTLT